MWIHSPLGARSSIRYVLLFSNSSIQIICDHAARQDSLEDKRNSLAARQVGWRVFSMWGGQLLGTKSQLLLVMFGCWGGESTHCMYVSLGSNMWSDCSLVSSHFGLGWQYLDWADFPPNALIMPSSGQLWGMASLRCLRVALDFVFLVVNPSNL